MFDLVFTRYPFVVNLVFITAGCFFTAKTINALLAYKLRELPSLENAPPAPAKLPTPQRAAVSELSREVLERNLMNARRDDLKPADEQNNAQLNPNDIKPCALASNLVAIIAGPTSESSYIVYKDPKTQETAVFTPREGRNLLPNDITLMEVHPGEAKFRRDNHVELCVLGDDSKQPQPTTVTATAGESTGEVAEGGGGPGVRKITENEFQIDQGEIDRVLANLNEVATDARLVPSFSGGKADGFKIFSIRPGSVYQKIGMMNGDVIQKINGYEMNSVEKGLEVYQKLRDSKSIVMQIERRGSVKTVTYNIR